MRKIYSDGTWLHYPELEFYYTQGEINVEPVRFILPKNRKEVSFTLIRKYSQQLITNADRQGANRNRELITFGSGRLSAFLSAFCYAVEPHF